MNKLPPTRDAALCHLKRDNYQAKIWLCADRHKSIVQSPIESGGWKMTENVIAAVFMTMPSVHVSCVELITCGCETKFRSAACKCHKANQLCMPVCGCSAESCFNTSEKQ